MNKAISIISCGILSAQITIMPQGRDLFQNALLLERNGDFDQARTLYEDMLRENPGTRRALVPRTDREVRQRLGGCPPGRQGRNGNNGESGGGSPAVSVVQ